MQPIFLSRRSLLQAVAATLGGAALSERMMDVAEAAWQAHVGPPPAGSATMAFFNAADAADVEAVAAQIVPTDDTPGAREAGVLLFIDRALTTFLAQLGDDYRGQLAGFQAACRVQHPTAASFAALTPAQQVAFLETVDRTAFFDTTRLLTLLGMFSSPAYGGNRDGIGWRLIGFEDRHSFRPPFGHYDRDYPGFVIDRTKTP